MHIIVDIGGTKMRVARSDDLKTLSEPSILDTPQNYGEALHVLVRAAQDRANGEAITSAAVGIACALSREKRRIYNSRNLADWNERNLADDLEAALHTKVVLENDAAMCGLGEYVFGAGQGVSIMVYVTVSTGVNGARIVDGRIDPAAFGFEIGGQYINGIDGDPKTLEELISGRAIAMKYGKPPQDLGADSPVWEELARELAFGLNNTILHWSPDRVVLGGSMFNDVGIPIDRVHEHLQHMKKKIAGMPEIVGASLKGLGGLYGGLARLLQIR